MAKSFVNSVIWLISQITRFRRAVGPAFEFDGRAGSRLCPPLSEQLRVRDALKAKALGPFAAGVVAELNAIAKLVGGTIKERARSSMQACFLEISDRIMAAVRDFGEEKKPAWELFPALWKKKCRGLVQSSGGAHAANKKKLLRRRSFLAVKKCWGEIEKRKRALRFAEEDLKRKARAELNRKEGSRGGQGGGK